MKYFILLAFFFQLSIASAFAQQYKYHIVQKGESVSSIARDYNISVETLFIYNPDARAGISVNSKLVVPLNAAPQRSVVDYKEHKVKRKETLFSLSREYNVSVDEIKKHNPHLYSEELRKGERIRIPVSSKEVQAPEVVVNPSGNPLGLSVKEHVVLPKETKYSISKKYNLSIEELENLNPGIDTLKPGMVLKVRKAESVKPLDERLFKYYQVQPQETLYSLTTKLGISRDSLEVLNPALRDGLKAGMVLKIPNPDAKETTADYTPGDIVRLESRISDYQPKDIVVMLPFGLDKIVSTDSTSNAAERIKKDRVLKISLDFYSGVLMAVDSAKALGLSTNVKVFDTKQSAYEVNSILSQNNFERVDAVIGPLVQSTVEAAVSKLQGSRIPVVSPLTKKEPRTRDNYIQARPTDEVLQDAMISYLSQNAEGKNIVIIADPSKGEIKRRLLATFTNSRTVNPINGSYISKSELNAALVEGRPNWVILESDNISVISDVTSALNARVGSREIVLFTTNRNDSFESDNISNRHLSNLKLTYPSVDKEFNSDDSAFISAYEKKYGVVPNTYAVRGFDVTYDVLLRLATAEDLMASMDEEGTTEHVENKFDYVKSPSGSYINRAIYILRYGEDMRLKVVQ